MKFNKWRSFKLFILKKWYKYILRREYKIGWKMNGPNAVIINDEHITILNVKENNE